MSLSSRFDRGIEFTSTAAINALATAKGSATSVDMAGKNAATAVSALNLLNFLKPSSSGFLQVEQASARPADFAPRISSPIGSNGRICL